MTIGVNGYEAVVPRFGYDSKTGLPIRVGSGEFCFQLLNALFEYDKTNEYLVYLPIEPTSDMPSKGRKWRYIVLKSKKLWTILSLSRKLFSDKNKLDVFFSPTHYLPFFAGNNAVLSILDVSYLRFPELFKKRDLYQLKFWGRLSIGRAKKIITISNSSKNDIIKEYGVKPEKVSVVYPGIKQVLSIKNEVLSMEELKKKFGIERKYILFVGTLQPRKNIVRLIEAFSLLKNEELDLIVIGKKGWMYSEIIDAPKKYDLVGRVKFLDSVNDDELPSFYKNAVCFVLPSLYEGFGLPVLEAMQNGCPVLTSNVSSLPEAGGDAAIYFDPENVEDMAAKIEKVVSDKKLREDMIGKGYLQVKKFSWEKAARETIKILESIGKNIT